MPLFSEKGSEKEPLVKITALGEEYNNEIYEINFGPNHDKVRKIKDQSIRSKAFSASKEMAAREWGYLWAVCKILKKVRVLSEIFRPLIKPDCSLHTIECKRGFKRRARIFAKIL